MNRDELKLGGIVALLGSVVGFVVNLFHPTPPADADELLRVVAANPHWREIHFFAMITALLIVSGMALLSRNLVGGMAAALGALGRYFFLVSGTAFAVMTMIDGFAFKGVADRLHAADAARQPFLAAEAHAVVYVERALFPVFAAVFLGLSFIVMGAAVWRSENFPRWLGLWGMIGGVMCVTVGVGWPFGINVPLPVWLIGLVAVVTWAGAMGVAMMRAAKT